MRINLLPKDSNKYEPVNFDDEQHHKHTLQQMSVSSVKFDAWAKIIIFVLFIVYVAWQVYTIHDFIYREMSTPLDKRLSPTIIITYIKYSLGFNSALLLVLGYWFGGKGGFSRLVNRVVTGIVNKKTPHG